MDRDPQKGITITYNHLDLPELISFDDGRKIECLYDASGRLWSKVLKASDESTFQTRNYVGSFELIDNLPYSVMHSEGRMVNEGLEGYLSYLYLDHQQKVAEQFRADEIESTGQIALDHTEYEGRTAITLSGGFEVSTGAEFSGEIVGAGTYSESWRYEWDIRDHLGNLRMTYTGPDRNNLEVLQRQTYYPYGQVINKNLATTLENKYAYNGIDWVGDFGLDWSMATYRSLDSRGVWNSVDPYTESFTSFSPYVSMGNNPISYTDPEGGFIHILIGGAIGGVGNLAYQAFTGNINSIGDGFAAFGIGAVAGGVGAATGGASLAATGAGTSFLGAVGAGALSGAVGGASAGLIQGTANAAYFQDASLGDALGAGLQGALYGGLTGAVLGGVVGGVSFKAPGTTSSTSSLADEITVTLDDGTTITTSPGRLEFPSASNTNPNALGGGNVYGNLDDVAQGLPNNSLPNVAKAVNSNLPHAINRGVARGVFGTRNEASTLLKNMSKQISKNGFPQNAFLDPSHLNRVLVPIGNNGLVSYQVAKNGTAIIKTVLNAR